MGAGSLFLSLLLCTPHPSALGTISAGNTQPGRHFLQEALRCLPSTLACHSVFPFSAFATVLPYPCGIQEGRV